MRHRVLLAIALMIMTLVALAAGCEDDVTQEDDVPTATEAEDAAATATVGAPTPPTEQDIREENLSNRPEVLEFMSTVGGEPELTDLIFADLTGDGLDEAVGHVSSGGTAGNLAVFVFGYIDGELRLLLREQPPEEESNGGHIRAEVEEGALSVTWPIYGPDDANCCPSGGTRTRFYRWDGSALAAEGEVTTPPDGELP